MRVNKDGTDWLLIKDKINDITEQCQETMLSLLPPDEYHKYRGMVLGLRALKDWVEPNTPVTTTEDDYGISDPEKDNY